MCCYNFSVFVGAVAAGGQTAGCTMPSVGEVEILAPPSGLEQQHGAVFTPEAVTFLSDCYSHFRDDIQTVRYTASQGSETILVYTDGEPDIQAVRQTGSSGS